MKWSDEQIIMNLYVVRYTFNMAGLRIKNLNITTKSNKRCRTKCCQLIYVNVWKIHSIIRSLFVRQTFRPSSISVHCICLFFCYFVILLSPFIDMTSDLLSSLSIFLNPHWDSTSYNTLNRNINVPKKSASQEAKIALPTVSHE